MTRGSSGGISVWLLGLSGLVLAGSPARAEEVANQASAPAKAMSVLGPVGICNAATLSCFASVLVYDDNSTHQFAMRALDWCGIPYTRASAADFVTVLTSQSWDVVVMDMPSNEPADSTWTTELENHIGTGGKAIHTHWNSATLTPSLQAVYEIAAGNSHETETFQEWRGCHRLFAFPNPVSGVFDLWTDVWSANGFRLTALGSALEVAGFTAAPSAGEAAIVIGNLGRTIFNGFLFDDFDPADKDSDLDPDMIELIVNELASFCAGPSCCGDTIRDPGEDCDSGGVDTSTCDSDCTLPSCGDGHWNAVAGEACDGGGVDTPTCDADCTRPSCGDTHANLPAGEGCDEGGVDTATCDADCTVPSCGDGHWNATAGEACDGGGVDTATCDADCTVPSCGDGHWNAAAGEACDGGGVDTAACDADCTVPSCGDGHWNAAAGEACDGGGVDTAACDADCTVPSCGDGHWNAAAGEACDGGGVDTAACDADCTVPSCGDGHWNAAAGEACDGGGVDTATCDADCTLPVCGDGHWNLLAGEGCDDGGTLPGDGCDANCQVEGCLVVSLSPLTLLKGVKEGSSVRFSWAPGAVAAISHVNQVAAKLDLATAWRSPRGTAVAACEASAGVQDCLDPTPAPAAPLAGYVQVVAACGSSGLDEGPF